MKKKIWPLVSLSMLAVIIYMLAVHFYIYHTIGVAALKATDNRHIYMVNSIKDKPRLYYVALGDSLTSGVGTEKYEQSYPFLLAEKLSVDNSVTHINFSYPGARTEDVIRDLLPKALAEKADVITLLVGTNDVHGGVSEEEFVQNYKFILSELTKKTKAKINVVSIPFIGDDSLLLPPYDYSYRKKILEFNSDIKLLAIQFGVRYIDLTTPTTESSHGGNGYYSIDKFHPSSLGYKMWADIIYDHLDK